MTKGSFIKMIAVNISRLARSAFSRITYFFSYCFLCLRAVVDFFVHIYRSFLNGKTPTGLFLDILVNCSLVIIWLLLLKLIKIIPDEWRRPICHRLCMRLDDYMFDSFFGSLLTVICLFLASYLVYTIYYKLDSPAPAIHPVNYKLETINVKSESTERTSSSSSGLAELDYDLELALPENNLKQYLFNFNTSLWKLTPPMLLALSWFLINFAYQFNSTIVIVKWKFIVAWVFYVILHFLSPLLICLWLYIFKPPGSVKLFLVSCGLLNIIIAVTGLILPTAPPIFIRLYGEHLTPTFDMVYADGISRKDMKVGLFIHKSIYYAAPTKFASMPSLHSAMACMDFLFVSYYGELPIIKFAALAHTILQWWASVYLEHHWRIDLLAGIIYSVAVFTVVKKHKYGLDANYNRLVNARLTSDTQSFTFGMRLFKWPKVRTFFDPISNDNTF